MDQNKSDLLIIDKEIYPFLDINYAITQLTKKDGISSLSEFLTNLTDCATTNPKLTTELAQTPEIVEPFIDALNADSEEMLIIQLIKAITSIFPNSGDNMYSFIDNGLIMSLYNFLESDSPQILESSISLVYVISNLPYGNESLLSFGIHQLLVDIVSKGITEELALQALSALHKSFSSKEIYVDLTMFAGIIEVMKGLIDFESYEVVNSVLLCLIEITNHSILFTQNLFDLNFCSKLISFLNVHELASASLNLIGNMCCNDKYIENLLQLDLFDTLMDFIDSEHKEDVYWILSNLIESAPNKIVNLLDQQFVENAIETAMISSFDIKKEATFCIACLSIFIEKEKLFYFMNEKFLDLMFEMLNCNINICMAKILDALIRLAKIAKENISYDIFFIILHNNEYISILNLISEGNQRFELKQKAQMLLDILNNEP